MFHTFMVRINTEDGQQLIGPCTRQELSHLSEQHLIDEDTSCIDEFLFKVLYPQDYCEQFSKNVSSFIYASLQKFYKCSKILSLSPKGIMADDFTLTIDGSKILLKLSMNMSNIHSAQLTQHLMEYIENTELTLILNNTATVDFTEN